jgi:Cu/Ag efflux protein CusF
MPLKHKINVSHGPISSLGWQAMTMEFPVGWPKYVDEGGSGDGGSCAIHRSLDRIGLPIVGT